MKGKKNNIVEVDERLREVIPFFFDETEKDFEKLVSFLAEKDFDALSRLAHTLKGECGGYGFCELGEMASKLERASTYEDLSECQKCVEAMTSYLSKVQVDYKEAA